jgi:hypothetical protein
MAERFVGRPTFDLCLMYLVQHMFAFRVGTSHYAQGMIAHAVRIAHDLDLQQGSMGIAGLQLYLLLYMSDQ